MILLTKKLPALDQKEAHATVELTIDQRIKSRLKVTLSNGSQAGLMLVRGELLRGGDQLTDEDGNYVVQVVAAKEAVSTIYSDDTLQMKRICYHLGNRHVPLQVENEFVRYQQDHVLDEMVVGLAGRVVHEMAPFEPEGGAYGGHSHSHSHSHAHDDDKLPHIKLNF